MVWPHFKVFWVSKETLQDIVKGAGAEEVEDNIKERTRVDFAWSGRAAKTRTRWKKSTCLQSRLLCPRNRARLWNSINWNRKAD